MRRCLILLGLVGLICTGCAGVQGLTSERGHADGVVYYLPRTVLEITVRQFRSTTTEDVWYSLGGPKNVTGNGPNEADSDPEKADLPGINEIRSHSIPDPDHRYVIKYNASAISDDRLCISRKPNGLLYDVQFAADDRTPQVAFNIAKFVGGFIGSPVFFDQREIADKKYVVRRYTGKVDPFREGDVEAFNRAMSRAFDAKIEIDFEKLHKTVLATAGATSRGCSKWRCPRRMVQKYCGAGHICYRTRLKLPVHLKHDGLRIDTKYAEVINILDLGAISVTRAFLVQKITKLRFEEGALSAAIIRKPSEVEEATLLPLNVMNAILTVPSGLWTGAFAGDSSKTLILDKLQTNQTEIQKLEKAQKNLLLDGDGPIGIKDAAGKVQEHYELNCVSGNRISGNLNIINPPVGQF